MNTKASLGGVRATHDATSSQLGTKLMEEIANMDAKEIAAVVKLTSLMLDGGSGEGNSSITTSAYPPSRRGKRKATEVTSTCPAKRATQRNVSGAEK